MHLASLAAILPLLHIGGALPRQDDNWKLNKRLPPTWQTPQAPEPFVEGPKFKDLWRGEIFRTPKDVEDAGGFDSHGKRIFEGKHPDYPEGMSAGMFHKGSSLYEHGVYKNPVSQYVPTSASKEAARNFATKPGKTGYLYKIRSTPDMVDVRGSLGGSQYYKNAHELEVAGVYDIPWTQVEGWHTITHSYESGDYITGKFERNLKFAPVKGEGTYSSHFSLAGWRENDIAWENEWWAPFRYELVEGMLNEHLLKYRFNYDMDAFKAFRPAEYSRLPCSTDRKRDNGWEACTRQSREGKTETKPADENAAKGGGSGDATPGEENTSVRNKGFGLLTRGQGYNTLLDRGLIPDAVIMRKGKRGVPTAFLNESVSQVTTMRFNFTAPSANLTHLDIPTYFAAPDTEAIISDILADLENKQNMTALNEIHTRATDQQDCTGKLTVSYKYTDSYDKYLKALEISGGATVSGWGQSASLSGSYLDQAEVSNKALTYIAIINVERQEYLPHGDFNMDKYKPSTFYRDFGDRWIRGFQTGGKMIARLTFNSKGSISKEDLKVHAEASLKFWGVTGDISASVKKSMEDVNKHADVEISLFYQGDLGRVMSQSGSPEKVSAESAEGSFKQVKSWADQFLNNACRHNYAYRPLLEHYGTAAGFPNQEPLDYSIAHLFSYKILKEIVRMSEMKQYLLSLETLDEEFKDEVEIAEVEMVDLGKKWVDAAVKEPKNALDTGKKLINTFRTRFFERFESAVKNQFYISGLDVVYGKEPPANRVIEVKHRSEDINHYFGGEFVWLVPVYTSRRDEACTSFTVIIGGTQSALKDVSKGAGGDNRYIRCEKIMSEKKIRHLALHRGSESPDDFLSDTYHGFVSKTTNINEGRGDEDNALYLLWAYDDERDENAKWSHHRGYDMLHDALEPPPTDGGDLDNPNDSVPSENWSETADTEGLTDGADTYIEPLMPLEPEPEPDP